MKKLLILLVTVSLCHCVTTTILAAETSEPPKSTYLTTFFNLYRFLPPQEILLYENADMARKDIKQEIVSDTRPKQGSDCTLAAPDQCKGTVVLQNEESPGHTVTQTLPDQGVCRPKDSERVVGYCDYRKKPTNVVDVTAIDYSKKEGLAYPKLQNRFYSYWNNGGDNTIAWGSDNLSTSASDQYVRRAITLAQAEETKQTQDQTGESPLGGVRWDAPLDSALSGTSQPSVSSTGPKCKTIVGTFISVGETVIGTVNGNGQDSVWKCGEDSKWQSVDPSIPITFKPASYTGAPAVCREGDNIYKSGDIIDGKEQCTSTGKLVSLTQDNSDKTLLDAWKELGGDEDSLAVKNDAKVLLSYWKNMVKPPPVGENEPLPGVSAAITSLTQIISKNLAKPLGERPLWLQYFMRTPECGPGYDKGYVLASVCMLGACTPVSSNEQFVGGNPKFRDQALYSDTRIRQNLCAAVYNVYQQYPLQEAQTIIRKAHHLNPLLDCTLRSDPACIPTAIEERLGNSLDSATYSMAKNKFFSLPWFHKIIDGWRSPDGGFWYVKIDFKLKSGGEYRDAGAIENVGVLGVLLNQASAIAQDWIDSVFQALHHTVVVPPLSAHSIDAIEQATVLIHQTAAQNKEDDATTQDYSNAVDAGALKLNAGNGSAPKTSQGFLGLWSCSDPNFSASWFTKIIEYISGNRIGCHGERNSVEKPAGGSICQIADSTGVPCCMLAGIWNAETDKGTNTPTQSYGAFKCCNAAGACGETQIMGGLVPPLSNGENLNPCKQADSFTLTARLLVVKKCQLDGGCQDNKWTPEVSKKYAVEDDELYIAGLYYGVNACYADQVAQCRWGTGKSYCDAVNYYMESGCSTTNPAGGKSLPDADKFHQPPYCNAR